MMTIETMTAGLDQAITYSLHVVFTRDADSDSSLDDAPAIRDEITSWLESLGATVHHVAACASEEARTGNRRCWEVDGGDGMAPH